MRAPFGKVVVSRLHPHRPVAGVGEDAQPAADRHREDHQPQLVDEVVVEQRVHERAAAVDQDRPAVARPSARHAGDDVALQHASCCSTRDRSACSTRRPWASRSSGRRTRPRRSATPRRSSRRSPARRAAGSACRGPRRTCTARCSGPDVVADPTGVRVGRLTAGRLHHAVEGHELGDDQLPHTGWSNTLYFVQFVACWA